MDINWDITYREFMDGLHYSISQHLLQIGKPKLSGCIASSTLDIDINLEASYDSGLTMAIVNLFSSYKYKKIFDKHKQELKELISVQIMQEPSVMLYEFNIFPKIEPPTDGWKEQLLEYIANIKINNQASFVSTKVPMCEYKGIKFRSKSEMKLCPFFEKMDDILFFPLPLAVSCEKRFEPDFLVCRKGKWAVLEVVSDMHHPSVEKEANRTAWFQNHNIQVRSYPANKCYNNPKWVVNDFIKWLSNL